MRDPSREPVRLWVRKTLPTLKPQGVIKSIAQTRSHSHCNLQTASELHVHAICSSFVGYQTEARPKLQRTSPSELHRFHRPIRAPVCAAKALFHHPEMASAVIGPRIERSTHLVELKPSNPPNRKNGRFCGFQTFTGGFL